MTDDDRHKTAPQGPISGLHRRLLDVNHECTTFQLVIDAFGELETGSAENVAARLNLGFAKAMGVKLEETGPGLETGSDSVVPPAATGGAALPWPDAGPHHPTILE